MHRRRFVASAIGGVLLKGEAEPVRTFTYKTAAGCDIKVDVFGMAEQGHKPAVVWIHGGALIMGSRKLSPGAPALRALLSAGFTVFSIDYRLAPETKLPAIIEDVRDAFRWVRSQSGMLHIDANRVGACGGSAGGYLTLMSGFSVEPRPKALVAFWGYGDIVGPWYSRPDPFYSRQPAVSHEEALAAVGQKPLSEPAAGNQRERFYLYCRQRGLWPKEVAGHDPDADKEWFARYNPNLNITGRYPPTMLVHGTADTDVPYEQSVLTAERLRTASVEHELITVPNGAHGLGNIAADERDRIYARAAGFLQKRV